MFRRISPNSYYYSGGFRLFKNPEKNFCINFHLEIHFTKSSCNISQINQVESLKQERALFFFKGCDRLPLACTPLKQSEALFPARFLLRLFCKISFQVPHETSRILYTPVNCLPKKKSSKICYTIKLKM